MKTMYRYLFAYILFAALAFLMLAGTLRAADLAWDYDEGHEITTMFYLVFTDMDSYCSQKTSGFCSYEFPVEDTEVVGGTVILREVESILNLHPGIEYTFTLARANDVGESGYSNSVTHIRPTHQGPGIDLPPPVLSPGQAGGLRIE